MTIVVGWIPTREGRAALRKAGREAQLRGTRLLIVQSGGGGREFGAEDTQAFEDVLGQVGQELDAVGLEHEVRQISSENDQAEDLIDVAEEESADLIVIGLRRRSAVGKLILGSNAQRILLDSAAPVLAVKATEAD